MDLIEEYIENIAHMKLSMDDYADRKKVRKSNRLADRNRKIAAIIEQNHPELKSRFLDLTESENEDVRGWVAHHVLEVMAYELLDRQKALRVITNIAKSSQDSLQRMGNQMWLNDYYQKHPQDREA